MATISFDLVSPEQLLFSNEVGMALPYVALQYTDIEIRVKLKEFDKLWITRNGNAPVGNFKILDCIFDEKDNLENALNKLKSEVEKSVREGIKQIILTEERLLIKIA